MPVGLLPDPYYWWLAGAMFGQLVEYWYYTGDTTYMEITTQGLVAQIGPDRDYMPPNQTKTEVWISITSFRPSSYIHEETRLRQTKMQSQLTLA